MKITDEKAREILISSSDDELVEMYMEVSSDEPIIETESYIDSLLSEADAMDRLKDFMARVQGDNYFDPYAQYTVLRIYNDDITSADTLRDLFSDDDWIITIQDYYEDIDEDDED